MQKGLIHIYTGNGKGKTTAAIGLAVRALGRNLKVIVIHFLKGSMSGEDMALKVFGERCEVHQFNSQSKFIWNMDETELGLLKSECSQAFKKVEEIIQGNQCDLLVLDEIISTVNKELINIQALKTLLINKPAAMEIVMTGRNAAPDLIELASYVTEMKKIRHPYDQGVKSRIGIES
jgi:cob(I)alamin adenosyltransferase